MAEITITVKGADQVADNLRSMAKATPDAVRASLHTESELIMTDIKEGGWVPKDTGALETSGHVVGTEITGGDIVSTLGFGGPSIPYALIQHEALHFHHPGQGQAKYLEAPLRLWAPRIIQPIVDRILRAWRGAIR